MFIAFFCFCICQTQIKYGSKWLKVFYHDSSTGSYFSSLSEALSTNNQYKYSILGSIDTKYRINEKFEFLLEYPGFDGYNRWKQSLNPKDDQEITGKKATGYEGVEISFPGRNWGGLVMSSNEATFFDVTAGYSSWWYSIGCKKSNWETLSFPGPAFNDTSYIPVSKVILWVRNDHLEPMTNNYKSETIYNLIHLFSLLACIF